MQYVNLTKNFKKNEITPPPINKKKRYASIIAATVSVILLITLFGNDLKAMFNPISIVASISQVNLKETDGRTNVLILGSDQRAKGEVAPPLTDTILVASIGRVEKDVVMMSLPRDLWVKSPKGYFTKINAIYANGGSEEMIQVVENVLGIPIHYYALIDFELFKTSIDILGGIDVNVENSFVDYFYPVEGKETAPIDERYEVVTFQAGAQQMDGDTALKFVRSRKGTNNEGTDFARAARQQKVIMAIKDKAFSLNTILNINKLKDLYETYEENVDTNVSFTDVQNFYLLSQQINFERIDSIVLDDRSAADEGGLLYSPDDTSLYGGSYVLLPKSGGFSQLHAYVQRYLFGSR
jgi:polyisoprenyl-teichoic acid--peptidoglycan teichoic acid transferase